MTTMTPAEMRALARTHSGISVVAAMPECPPALLLWIAKGDNESAHYTMAMRADLTPDLHKVLWETGCRRVQEKLVAHPICPEPLLRAWSRTWDVMKNPKCPQDILEKEARCSTTAKVVAEHPNCPPSLWEKLSNHAEWDVRKGLAANPKCPEHLLRKLAVDPCKWVRKRALSNPSCPSDVVPIEETEEVLAADPALDVQIQLAKSSTSPETLLNLWRQKDIHFGVQNALMENPAFPVDGFRLVVEAWEQDGEKGLAVYTMGERALRNPSFPLSLLKEIAKSPKVTTQVRAYMLQSPAMTRDFAVELFEQAEGKEDKVLLAMSARKVPSLSDLAEPYKRDIKAWEYDRDEWLASQPPVLSPDERGWR